MEWDAAAPATQPHSESEDDSDLERQQPTIDRYWPPRDFSRCVPLHIRGNGCTSYDSRGDTEIATASEYLYDMFLRKTGLLRRLNFLRDQNTIKKLLVKWSGDHGARDFSDNTEHLEQAITSIKTSIKRSAKAYKALRWTMTVELRKHFTRALLIKGWSGDLNFVHASHEVNPQSTRREDEFAPPLGRQDLEAVFLSGLEQLYPHKMAVFMMWDATQSDDNLNRERALQNMFDVCDRGSGPYDAVVNRAYDCQAIVLALPGDVHLIKNIKTTLSFARQCCELVLPKS